MSKKKAKKPARKAGKSAAKKTARKAPARTALSAAAPPAKRTAAATMPDVDITWVDGSPWGGAPIKVCEGNCRKDIINGNKGTFKYNVTCNGYTEDPEIEYPVN
jgi:hypothetical protein